MSVCLVFVWQTRVCEWQFGWVFDMLLLQDVNEQSIFILRLQWVKCFDFKIKMNKVLFNSSFYFTEVQV